MRKLWARFSERSNDSDILVKMEAEELKDSRQGLEPKRPSDSSAPFSVTQTTLPGPEEAGISSISFSFAWNGLPWPVLGPCKGIRVPAVAIHERNIASVEYSVLLSRAS